MREQLKKARIEAGNVENKIQTGLRIPESRYNEINLLAKAAGVSVNTMVLMLMDLGIKVINLGTSEVRHSSLQNPQDTSLECTLRDC